MSEMTIESLHAETQQLHAKVERFMRQTKIAASIEVAMISIGLREDERYAGAVLNDDGTIKHHLIVMAERKTSVTWQEALDWAASIGGAIPTLQELSLIVANCKKHIGTAWHWSCETHESNASYAWGCGFDSGYQSYGSKSAHGAAVAVRRLIP